MFSLKVGEMITVTTSLSAGLPVFYQIVWGDGAVTKLYENGSYVKGESHEIFTYRFSSSNSASLKF